MPNPGELGKVLPCYLCRRQMTGTPRQICRLCREEHDLGLEEATDGTAYQRAEVRRLGVEPVSDTKQAGPGDEVYFIKSMPEFDTVEPEYMLQGNQVSP